MSSIQATLYRSHDHRLLKVNLKLDRQDDCDYKLISFKCGDNKLNINSTSTGNIDQEGNVKMTALQAEMYVDYCESSDNLECLIGYYNKNELNNYETLVVPFDNEKSIIETHISVPSIGTIPGSYMSRFSDFRSALKRVNSSWKVLITCPDDILLQFEKTGKTTSMACFGETGEELGATDVVFQIKPDMKQLNIPKDLLKSHYDQYSPGCKLGVFELIQPDFLGVKNVFYKILISNTMTLSSFK